MFLDWSDAPASKKDILKTLGAIALVVWLSDSDKVEQNVKQLREKVGGLIAGKPDVPTP